MITLFASVVINASSKKVFSFFNHLKENYPTMHPDHIECKCPEGLLKEDEVIHVKEMINGSEMNLRLHLMNVTPERIDYDLPFGASGAFIIEARNGTTILTEEFNIGFRFLGFIDKLITRLFSKELEGINNHMEDELINIKKTIEEINITRWG